MKNTLINMIITFMVHHPFTLLTATQCFGVKANMMMPWGPRADYKDVSRGALRDCLWMAWS